MKGVRIVLVLLFIAAVASFGAYLLSKRQTPGAPTNSDGITETTNSGVQATPRDAVVFANTTPTKEIVIEASEYKFTPNTVTIKKGESVKITLKNTGKMPHDWFVENMGGANIDMTSAGGTNSIIVRASQTGTFTTYCSIGNHRKQGMVGKLIVQ